MNTRTDRERSCGEIVGQGAIEAIRGSELFDVSPRLYRLLILLSISSFASVWTTGYLRELMMGLSLPLLLMLFFGRGLFNYPRLIQIGSVVVLLYSLSVYRGNYPGVVVLIEFATLILFLHLQILTNSIAVAGVLILTLMLILAVAAMNVNFLFPLSLFPYLFFLFLTLQKLVAQRHQKINASNPFYTPERGNYTLGATRKFLVAAGFLFLWIALFYLIPRSESFGLASEASRRRLQGFSETLRLGDGGLLEDNPAVVMRVMPTDNESLSTSIIRRLRSKLLRGTSFAVYSNGRWERNQTRRWYVDLRKTQGVLEIMKDYNHAKSLHQLEIILENNEPPVIFFPDQTVNSEIDASFVAFESDNSMFFLGKSPSRRRYLVRLLINPVEIKDVEVTDLNVTGPMRVYLSTVGVDNSVRELAQKIGSGSRTINQSVQATINYLQKTCNYSLFEDFRTSIDPVVYFLFTSKSGSCEHFATAMTLLLRQMGIPARPVSGYSMGEWNEMGGFFTVRQRHAHTWVEVYFPGSGWIPFDPSPVAELYEPEGNIEKLFVWLWELYEQQWFGYVYSFDQKIQVLGFKRIEALVYSVYLNLLGFSLLKIFSLFLLLFIGAAFVNVLRRRFATDSLWIPIWYLEWSDKLSLTRHSWETPLEFHLRLIEANIFPNKAEPVLAELASLVDKSSLKGADKQEIKIRAVALIGKLKHRIGFDD